MDAWMISGLSVLAGLFAGLALLFLQRGRWQADAARQGEQIAGLEAGLTAARGQVAALEASQARLDAELRVSAAARATAEAVARRVPELEATLAERAQALARLGETQSGQQARISELETLLMKEREAATEKLAVLEQAERKLADAFKSLSAEALKSNNQAFLDLARQNLGAFQETAKGELTARQLAVDALVKPIHQALEKLGTQTQEMEKARVHNFGELSQQVRGLMSLQQDLKSETGRLVTALRRPEVRGRWGEVQLKRVVEMAGMQDHCDFYEQEATGDGRRPDMVVRLPGGKTVVLDSKAPVTAYLEAVEAEHEDARGRALARFVQHVRTHIQQLAAKAYWDQFSPSPEFVVMFLPGEAFFSAALQQDPELIEYASAQKVILATPTTLLALLKAVYYGWRQEALADNARQVSQLGAQLYERLAKLGEHWSSVGKNLGQAVKAYNDATGSLETRVLVTARKFEDLQVAPEGKFMPVTLLVDQAARELQAPELVADRLE